MTSIFDPLLSTALNQYKKAVFEPPANMLTKFSAGNKFDLINRDFLLSGIHNKEGYPYLLSLIARQIKDGLIVELGCRYGISTVAIGSHLPEKTKFVAIDIVKDARYIPDALWSMPNFRFVEADALNVARVFGVAKVSGQTVDVLFSDTEHTYEQLHAEFLAWQPLLSDEALFIVDDINLNDKRKFFDDFEGERMELTDLCHSSGFAIMVVKASPRYKGMSFADRLKISAQRSLDYYSNKHVTVITPSIISANFNSELASMAGHLQAGNGE